MIAPIFLSASEPNPARQPEYWDARNLLNVREAVRALCGYALGKYPIVFGGHPAITPLVRGIADRNAIGLRSEDAHQAAPRFLLFQSALFVKRKSSEEEIVTPPHAATGEAIMEGEASRNQSLLRMRLEMIGTPKLPATLWSSAHRGILRDYADQFGRQRAAALGTFEFSAAVFIGGMEGVEREFRIFRAFHPHTPAFPIATTGSACASLLSEIKDYLGSDTCEALENDTAYSLLMQRLLPFGGTRETPMQWRKAESPKVHLEDLLDPVEIEKTRLIAARDFSPQI